MSPTPTWSLGTTAHEGRLDSVSALVELGPRYDARHASAIECALRDHDGHAEDDWSRGVVGTAYHEATHFLDLTATNWGLEYTIRKLRLVQSSMAATPDADELADRLEVFMLSSAELGMHRHLAHTGDRSPAACDTLRHQVRVDPRFGPLIEIHYIHAGAMHHLVPLSIATL